jgi:hypothetical protein
MENEERWLLLINQLENAGAEVDHHNETFSFHRQKRIRLSQTDLVMYVVFNNPIHYMLLVDSSFVCTKFQDNFDSFPDRYKNIFVFYLDLMENQKF